MAKTSSNGCTISEVSSIKASKKSRPKVELNPTWTCTERRAQLAQDWQQKGNNETSYCFHQPFAHCVLSELLSDSCLASVEEALLSTVDYSEKDSDLFRFRQSKDLSLKKDSCPEIKELVKTISEDVKDLVASITNLPLNSSPVDIFSAQYIRNDYLLCHDDQLEGRRIAYILYLTPENWEVEVDGGALDLFNEATTKIVKSLSPKRNTLVFFEVSDISFHQVAEVLSKDKVRLSIGGWFHMDEAPKESKSSLLTKEARSEKDSIITFERALEDVDEDLFYSFINPSYLDEQTQMDIQKSFEDNSEISLANFLNQSVYQEVCSVLKDSHKWQTVGVAYRRRVKMLDSNINDGHKVVSDLMRVFKSDAMFLLLSKLTGLELHPLANTENDSDDGNGASVSALVSSSSASNLSASSSLCNVSVRKWERDCYTLLADADDSNDEFALDALLYFDCDKWSSDCGGQSIYVARDDDNEQLLSSWPKSNALNLVYRDNETVGFVKKVNANIESCLGNSAFFDLCGVYKEK